MVRDLTKVDKIHIARQRKGRVRTHCVFYALRHMIYSLIDGASHGKAMGQYFGGVVHRRTQLRGRLWL